MTPFGISLGPFYPYNISEEEKLRLLLKCGATATELVFVNHEQVMDFMPRMEFYDLFNQFDFRTIHAPFVKLSFGDNKETAEIFKVFADIMKRVEIHAITFHPNTVENYDILSQSGLPVSIENMDKNKQIGIMPEYFRDLRSKYDFNYTLDLHHIITHDPTMALTEEFVEAMGDKLQYFHISGQTGDEGHLPIHMGSDNQLISNSAKACGSKPIILEGTLRPEYGDLETQIRLEIDYVKEHLL